MQKQQIFDLFNAKISKTAIKPDGDGGYQIDGRYAEVQFFDNQPYFEIYLRSKTEKPLGMTRVNRFIELMQGYALLDYEVEWDAFHVWDGEAMARPTDVNAVLDNLKWFGIRRKRKTDPNWVAPWKK